ARRLCAFFEHRDGGELLSFGELEKSAAGGRNIGNVLRNAVFLDRRERIAAARDRERRAAGNRLRQRAGALAELIELEDADRSVPHDRARIGEELRESLSR